MLAIPLIPKQLRWLKLAPKKAQKKSKAGICSNCSSHIYPPLGFISPKRAQIAIRGMLIPDAFLIDEIRATGDYKEYKTVFVGVAVQMNQPQPVVST
ncbi:hypothetical protein Tco_0781819 [Tanacetum coccineum]